MSVELVFVLAADSAPDGQRSGVVCASVMRVEGISFAPRRRRERRRLACLAFPRRARVSGEHRPLRATIRDGRCNSGLALRSFPLPCRAPKPPSADRYQPRYIPSPATGRDLDYNAPVSVEVREAIAAAPPKPCAPVQWLPTTPAQEQPQECALAPESSRRTSPLSPEPGIGRWFSLASAKSANAACPGGSPPALREQWRQHNEY